MYVTINGAAYPCAGRPRFTDPVCFTLPGDKPDASALGDVITLVADDGAVLREVDISGITQRRYYDGDRLVITNAPEPAGSEPGTGASPQEDTDAMLVDHEYRLVLLELGVTE